MGGRSVATLGIPVLAWLNEFPVLQIGRMPVAVGTGDKHVIFASELHHGRISARTVGYVTRRIVDHVGVIDIERVTVGVVASVPAVKRRHRKYTAD